MVYKSGQIFLPFCHNPRVTDRRTDGQTEISSQYRGCITCSAVKNCRISNWMQFVTGSVATLLKLNTAPTECCTKNVSWREMFACFFLVGLSCVWSRGSGPYLVQFSIFLDLEAWRPFWSIGLLRFFYEVYTITLWFLLHKNIQMQDSILFSLDIMVFVFFYIWTFVI